MNAFKEYEKGFSAGFDHGTLNGLRFALYVVSAGEEKEKIMKLIQDEEKFQEGNDAR